MAATHASVVQASPSLQFFAAPGEQDPPLQVSPTVQAAPSSQAAVLWLIWQPPEHTSVVQGFLSSQSASTLQLPPVQPSILACAHAPVADVQASEVQASPSSQLFALPPKHLPSLQASLNEQALPSLQLAVLLT